MLLERLFENLKVEVEPFATCGVAAGWRLCLPALDWVTFHFVLEGEGSLSDQNGTTHLLTPHTLAVVQPRCVHSIACGEKVDREVDVGGGATIETAPPQHFAGPPEQADLTVACGRVKVTYGAELGLFDRLQEFLVLDFSDSEQMRAVFDGLLRERRSGSPASKAMMAALMNQCLVMVFRRLSSHRDCRLPWLSGLDDPQLAPPLDAVLARPEQPYSLESLATLANMSRSVFAKRFHDSFGRTPMRYVREVRLRRGAHMLVHEGRLSVETIAHRVGFDSRSQFSRAFHELFGRSPTAFRAPSAA